ncbi:hypothetical protein AVEN_187302-1 [Araneus ventricosus]|uniref:Uncharacterized protein n=1 Tax=Araneus ventricosus TaxID=182803 RepID=A0A4Y2TNR5_ARAVE|nr:hypothetical protein AVEN_187302-1 [Araneus ventricosus]
MSSIVVCPPPSIFERNRENTSLLSIVCRQRSFKKNTYISAFFDIQTRLELTRDVLPTFASDCGEYYFGVKSKRIHVGNQRLCVQSACPRLWGSALRLETLGIRVPSSVWGDGASDSGDCRAASKTWGGIRVPLYSGDHIKTLGLTSRLGIQDSGDQSAKTREGTRAPTGRDQSACQIHASSPGDPVPASGDLSASRLGTQRPGTGDQSAQDLGIQSTHTLGDLELHSGDQSDSALLGICEHSLPGDLECPCHRGPRETGDPECPKSGDGAKFPGDPECLKSLGGSRVPQDSGF